MLFLHDGFSAWHFNSAFDDFGGGNRLFDPLGLTAANRLTNSLFSGGSYLNWYFNLLGARHLYCKVFFAVAGFHFWRVARLAWITGVTFIRSKEILELVKKTLVTFVLATVWVAWVVCLAWIALILRYC